LPKASSLEDEIKKEIMADFDLIAGSGGIFEVIADGKKVFSKAQANRFPEPGEIVKIIKSL